VTVTRREDGRIVLDWEPPSGPFVVLTWEQYRDLLTVLRAGMT
jgi:hypothetical protein